MGTGELIYTLRGLPSKPNDGFELVVVDAMHPKTGEKVVLLQAGEIDIIESSLTNYAIKGVNQTQVGRGGGSKLTEIENVEHFYYYLKSTKIDKEVKNNGYSGENDAQKSIKGVNSTPSIALVPLALPKVKNFQDPIISSITESESLILLKTTTRILFIHFKPVCRTYTVVLPTEQSQSIIAYQGPILSPTPPTGSKMVSEISLLYSAITNDISTQPWDQNTVLMTGTPRFASAWINCNFEPLGGEIMQMELNVTTMDEQIEYTLDLIYLQNRSVGAFIVVILAFIIGTTCIWIGRRFVCNKRRGRKARSYTPEDLVLSGARKARRGFFVSRIARGGRKRGNGRKGSEFDVDHIFDAYHGGQRKQGVSGYSDDSSLAN